MPADIPQAADAVAASLRAASEARRRPNARPKGRIDHADELIATLQRSKSDLRWMLRRERKGGAPRQRLEDVQRGIDRHEHAIEIVRKSSRYGRGSTLEEALVSIGAELKLLHRIRAMNESTARMWENIEENRVKIKRYARFLLALMVLLVAVATTILIKVVYLLIVRREFPELFEQ